MKGRVEKSRCEKDERASIIESNVDNLYGQVQNLQRQAEKAEDKIASCETCILDIKEFLSTGDISILSKGRGVESSNL